MSFSREIKADKIADVLGILAAKCPEVREIIPSSGRTDGFYSAVESLSEFIELLELESQYKEKLICLIDRQVRVAEADAFNRACYLSKCYDEFRGISFD